MIRFTLAFALCSLLVLPAAAQESSAPTETADQAGQGGSEQNIAQQVSVNDITADAAIETRLARILRATEWFDQIEVEVRDSVTFLNGTTTTDERKSWAGQLARNTEGVAAVVNHIQVTKIINLSENISLVYTSVKSLWDDFLMQSPLIVAALLSLLVTGVVSKIASAVVSRIAKRGRIRGSMHDLILQLLVIGVWTVGLLVAAVIMFPGMTPARALTVLGLGSVAIGFAFKDIFENFFAGILILWKYPFDKGDFVECGELKGKIEDITIRMTMIRQVDGQLAVVPNALLFKNPVDVLTDKSSRRTTVVCGVAYDTDLSEAQEVIRSAVKGCATVRTNEAIEVFAQELADSSINFEVTWWTGATPLDIRESRDEVVRVVKRALDDAGIEIPFPQRILWLPNRDQELPA